MTTCGNPMQMHAVPGLSIFSEVKRSMAGDADLAETLTSAAARADALAFLLPSAGLTRLGGAGEVPDVSDHATTQRLGVERRRSRSPGGVAPTPHGTMQGHREGGQAHAP